MKVAEHGREHDTEVEALEEQPQAVPCRADAQEHQEGREANEEEEVDFEQEEAVGQHDGEEESGSWYDVDDGFIDDSDLLDDVGEDGVSTSDHPAIKASGFFISRGKLQTEAQLEEQKRLRQELATDFEVDRQPRRRAPQRPLPEAPAATPLSPLVIETAAEAAPAAVAPMAETAPALEVELSVTAGTATPAGETACAESSTAAMSPLAAAEARERLQRVGAQRAAALEALRLAVGQDERMSKLQQQAVAGDDTSTDGSSASKKGIQLPQEVVNSMLRLCRCKQLDVHLHAAIAGKQMGVSAKDGLPTSTWLDKQLVQAIAEIVPLTEKSLRGRLRAIGLKASLPERLESLRVQQQELLKALALTVASAAAQQKDAYDREAKAAKESEKQRCDSVARAAHTDPSSLVGVVITVVRGSEGAKRSSGRVLDYLADSGTHSVQLEKDGPVEQVDLRLTRWSPKPSLPPGPKFEWSTDLEAAFLEVCLKFKEAFEAHKDWVRLALPEDLRGLAAADDPIEALSDADVNFEESAEFKSLISRVHKFFPSKFITPPKLVAVYNRLKVALSKKSTALLPSAEAPIS